ncbi:MAG: ABC transporter substrate-binding protein [Candidatus Hodarchaeales archaeon]|jgi:ABC-type transport system substrate-binding protein
MKKNITTLALLLVITSIILPVIPIVYAQEEVPPYRVATYAPVGNWDGPISEGWSVIDLSFAPVTFETGASGRYSFMGGAEGLPIADEWYPILCTDWENTYWPSEENQFGWNNTGGVMSSVWTLREGVKFHDGSDWNATVMKWNIDRYYLITANLTGEGDLRIMDYYNPETIKSEKYWTKSWNLSAYKDTWGFYNVTKDVDYPNVNELPDGTVRNPYPWNGVTAYTSWSRAPLINRVEIVEDKQSGGKVEIFWNSWNSYGGEGMWFEMMSYHAYHKNYTGRGVYGYQNGIKEPRNPTIVDHMIGTGPYKYVENADEDGGYLVKFEDYWNKTALEAEGLFDIERIEYVNFPSTEAGGLAMNNALLSHAVDVSGAGGGGVAGEVDVGAVEADPDINYFPAAPSGYLEQITLNCINETYWAWPFMKGYSSYIDQGDINGIPQALRKALSYAYDYDYIIDVALEGEAVRQGGLVGQANLYYNSSVPQATFDVDLARNILLTTENDTSERVDTWYHQVWGGYFPNLDLYNFSKRTAERGLTASSTDAEWQAVAESSDPVWEVDFYWDPVHEDTKDEFQKACNRLGVALKDPTGLTNRVQTRIWDVVQIYWQATFPSGSSIWSAGAWPMPYWYAPTTVEAWIEFNYRDPSEGNWRTSGYAGVATDYWPRWNFGFIYDDRINDGIDRYFMSSPDQKKKWISKLADIVQNERYPFIYSHQSQGGTAQWDCWEVGTGLYTQTRTGLLTDYWGVSAGGAYLYSHINYKGCPESAPLIPGYSVLMTITVSMISILGISYIIMRRKKLR